MLAAQDWAPCTALTTTQSGRGRRDCGDAATLDACVSVPWVINDHREPHFSCLRDYLVATRRYTRTPGDNAMAPPYHDPAERGYLRLFYRLLPQFICPADVGNRPLACCRQQRTMFPEMAKRRKQFQPRSGVEKAFGEVMRTTREELGLSQMGLHVRTGLDRTFISDLERGVQCPSLRTIFRRAQYTFHRSLRVLLS